MRKAFRKSWYPVLHGCHCIANTAEASLGCTFAVMQFVLKEQGCCMGFSMLNNNSACSQDGRASSAGSGIL